MAIQGLERMRIRNADFIWSDANDGTVLLVDLKSIRMPRASEVTDVAPKLTELGESRARNFSKGMKCDVVNNSKTPSHSQHRKDQRRR